MLLFTVPINMIYILSYDIVIQCYNRSNGNIPGFLCYRKVFDLNLQIICRRSNSYVFTPQARYPQARLKIHEKVSFV